MVKDYGSTIALPSILIDLSMFEEARMRGVAVKCIDITQNTNCEGRSLTIY